MSLENTHSAFKNRFSATDSNAKRNPPMPQKRSINRIFSRSGALLGRPASEMACCMAGECARGVAGLQVRSRPQTAFFYNFASCRARAALILRATRRNAGPRRSCSQIRITLQPRKRSSLVCARSRWMLRPILASQYGRFTTGMEPQRGQPCQKQPSTNTANRARGNAKSGFPVIG